MAYTIKWLVDEQVLLVRLYDDVSLDEVAHIIALVSKQAKPSYAIVDTRAIGQFPTNIKALLQVLTRRPNRYEGKTIIWTTNRLLMIVILSLRAVAEMLQSRLLVLQHPLAIRQYLASLDPTLPRLPVFEEVTSPTFPPLP